MAITQASGYAYFSNLFAHKNNHNCFYASVQGTWGQSHSEGTQEYEMTNGREIERRLGEAYAQNLRESAHTQHVQQDCKEIIQASLGVMEHYNKIALAMKGALKTQQPVFATVPNQG